MTESDINKEYVLEDKTAAEFLREVADAIEDEEQLNIKLGEQKVIQPLDGDVPLRIYQDENGTEIGFRLNSES